MTARALGRDIDRAQHEADDAAALEARAQAKMLLHRGKFTRDRARFPQRPGFVFARWRLDVQNTAWPSLVDGLDASIEQYQDQRYIVRCHASTPDHGRRQNNLTSFADSLAEVAAVRGMRPPTDAEMLLAKASLTRGYPRGFETAQQVARSVAVLSLYGLPDSYFEEFVPKVNAVTSADVVAAASRHLHPARLTTLIVGDYSAIADSLRSLNLGEPQLHAADF